MFSVFPILFAMIIMNWVLILIYYIHSKKLNLFIPYNYLLVWVKRSSKLAYESKTSKFYQCFLNLSDDVAPKLSCWRRCSALSACMNESAWMKVSREYAQYQTARVLHASACTLVGFGHEARTAATAAGSALAHSQQRVKVRNVCTAAVTLTHVLLFFGCWILYSGHRVEIIYCRFLCACKPYGSLQPLNSRALLKACWKSGDNMILGTGNNNTNQMQSILLIRRRLFLSFSGGWVERLERDLWRRRAGGLSVCIADMPPLSIFQFVLRSLRLLLTSAFGHRIWSCRKVKFKCLLRAALKIATSTPSDMHFAFTQIVSQPTPPHHARTHRTVSLRPRQLQDERNLIYWTNQKFLLCLLIMFC